jgi:hypothetical protein
VVDWFFGSAFNGSLHMVLFVIVMVKVMVKVMVTGKGLIYKIE